MLMQEEAITEILLTYSSRDTGLFSHRMLSIMTNFRLTGLRKPRNAVKTATNVIIATKFAKMFLLIAKSKSETADDTKLLVACRQKKKNGQALPVRFIF